MLRIELPVTYPPMKLSPRLAGPNADGAAFNGFIYSTLRSEIALYRSRKIILVVDLSTVCIDLPSRINVRYRTSSCGFFQVCRPRPDLKIAGNKIQCRSRKRSASQLTSVTRAPISREKCDKMYGSTMAKVGSPPLYPFP